MMYSLNDCMPPNTTYFNLPNYAGLNNVAVKLEGLNIAGSIKLKTANYLMAGLEQSGKLSPNTHHVIESSSGNLGVALTRLYEKVSLSNPHG